MTTTNPGHHADALLSVGQAAERLGTPIRFVRRLVAERRIPFHRVGRYIRIAESDLDAFVAAGRVEAGKPPASGAA
jgi:excisionase family DNA binding protein